jgi:FKBP-type peptidyl-prolyl cis-trans isomerase
MCSSVPKYTSGGEVFVHLDRAVISFVLPRIKDRTMKFRLAGVALAIGSLTLTACADGNGSASGSAALDTDDQKASYGIGLNMAAQLAVAEARIDRAALMRGIEDALQGNDPALPDEEIQAVLMAFGQEIEVAAAAERDQAAEDNAIAAEAYLAENGRKEGVTTSDSGLQYEVLRAGDGAVPTADQSVQVNYRGSLIDGTEFDSSYDRGEPAVFMASGLIPGFTEALLMMPVGSHYRVVIPSDIAYGPAGSGPIGPNATLIFEIELLDIVD